MEAGGREGWAVAGRSRQDGDGRKNAVKGETRGAARAEVTARCFSQGNLLGKRSLQQDLSPGVPKPPGPVPTRGLRGFTACGAGMGALSLRGIHPEPGKSSL